MMVLLTPALLLLPVGLSGRHNYPGAPGAALCRGCAVLECPWPWVFPRYFINVQKWHFLSNSLPTFNKHSPRVL